MTDSGARWLILLDFDGTITLRDADFEIADAALPGTAAATYRVIAAAYERLQMGGRDYFEGYLRAVPLTPDEFATHAARVPLRPGLKEFVASCRAREADVRVVSEGLDVYVLPALAAAGLADLPVSCNRAVWHGGSYDVAPAPDAESCPRCLNCKGAHVRRDRRAGRRVAVVGNGASDLCAARVADAVFACDGLMAHCEREGIPHTPFSRYDDVLHGLFGAQRR